MSSIQDALDKTAELETQVTELIALIPDGNGTGSTDTQPIIDAIQPILDAVNAAIAQLQTPA